MGAVLACSPLFGQFNTGEIGGSVRDQAGGVLVGAKISAERTTTGIRYNAVTNSAGEYLVPQLPPGDYRLTASADGFRQSVLPDISVHPGDQMRREFILELGDRSDVVTVDVNANPLEMGSGSIRDGIPQPQALALPLKGRQFLDLAMLGEGVVRPPGGTRGDALQQAGTLVNVLGQRSGHNLYTVDGASVTDQHFNNMVLSPSIDSIEEVQIEKTSYAPEFGGKSGAVINVVTASGSNSLHASLFEFLRNDIFDAKNFFDSAAAPIPPFRQNQFGGSAGGPLVRNKTFFFVSYEGQRIRKSLTQTFSVPTSAMRMGDFNGQAIIYDPLANNGTGRVAFPNNAVPANRLDPVAQAMLATIPLPNLPGVAQNLLSTQSQRVNGSTYSARLDHQFGPADTSFLRASIFDVNEFDPFGSSVLQESLLSGFGRGLRTHTISDAAGWTHIFNPGLLNEFRFGFLSVAGGQTSPNSGVPFAQTAGLLGVTTNPVDMGYPQISFGGEFSTMGDPALFTYRDNHDFELYDNVIRHTGAHTIKLGAYFFKFNFQPVNPNGARGVFSFTPRWTSSAPGAADGNAFADFLLGYPTTAQVGLGRAAMDANTAWAHFYAQDDWQITSRFKVDFGIRYEYNQNMTDSENRMAAVDMSVPGGRFVIASPSAGPYLSLIPIPYVTASSIGWNNSLLTPRNIRVAPRAGVAWNVPGSRATVIRAGFGVYPNQAAYSIVSNFAQNLPFFVTKTVNTTATALTPVFSTPSILTANTIGTVGANNLNHNFRIEYNEVWNLNVERELPFGLTA
ncbi:MAG: carboxypeptidase regulatory-like domain-containing protein, partial [Acidobacteriia bacterium]|nr:carboxypeptidase regulatory-like domain-containing protein [Terriglobia bacterium]